MRIASDPQFNPDEYAVPIEQGGTAAVSVATAAANLKLVTTAMVGQANGPVALDATGKVDPSKFPAIAGTNLVNLQGNFFVIINTTVTFQITDYDSFKNYTVTASAGTVSRNGDTITYVAPSSAQAVTLTVNGRVINFNVNLPSPQKPVIQTPTNGSVNVADTPSITSSAFVPLGDSSTHSATDWQLATDSGFTTIVGQSIGDTTNKTTWTAPNLTVATTYYLRNRYKGSNGNYSLYSDTSTFTTRANFTPNAEESTGVIDSSYADPPQRIAISDDGLRVAVASYYFSAAAKIIVVSRASGSWVLEQTIATVTNGMNGADEFMSILDLSGTGDRLIFGEPNDNTGATRAGACSIWSRSGTTWTQEARFFNPNGPTASNQFAHYVQIDQTGSRVLIWDNAGSIYTYTRVNTTWTIELNLVPPIGMGNSFYLKADKALSCIVFYNVNGSVSVYDRNGTVWSLTTSTWQPFATGLSTASFGVSTGGQTIVVANGANIGVFKRNGNVWTQFGNTPATTAPNVTISQDGSVILSFVRRSGQTMQFLRYTSGTWALSTAFGPVTTPTKSIEDVTVRADGNQVVCACQTKFASFM